VGDQVAEQLELLGCELHLLTGAGHVTGYQIDGEIARDEHRCLAWHLEAMASSAVESRRQFGHAERFADAVVGAEIENLDLRLERSSIRADNTMIGTLDCLYIVAITSKPLRSGRTVEDHQV
jgi:hypothetical protein